MKHPSSSFAGHLRQANLSIETPLVPSADPARRKPEGAVSLEETAASHRRTFERNLGERSARQETTNSKLQLASVDFDA